MRTKYFIVRSTSYYVIKVLLISLLLNGFTVYSQCPTPPGDQTSFGQGEWIGYVYTGYTPGSPPAAAFGGTYNGYITETETFNHAFGAGAVSGANLCGTYTDFFAIRYKMEKVFSPGYYRLIFGGDDGYRLSVDGGATYPDSLNPAWNSHGYYTSAPILYLDGTSQLVLDYYEDGGGAQVSFSYELMDCTSTAPTSISGDTELEGCAPSNILTAQGGMLGVGSNYQWGTGTTVGENIIFGQQGVSLTVTAPGHYWVRRVAAYECAGPTAGVVTEVTQIDSTPGDPAVFGDNIWNVYGYTGSNAAVDVSGLTYQGYYTQSTTGFDSDLAWNRNDGNPSETAGWQGCSLPDDNFSFVHKRKGFPCGLYAVTVNDWDDRIRVFIDGQLVFSYDGWSGGAPAGVGVLGNFFLTEDSEIEVKVAEDGGGANAQISFSEVSQVPSTPPTAIIGNSTVCKNAALSLSAQGGSLGTNAYYEWGTGSVGSNVIEGENSSSIVVIPQSDITYWVRITNPCGAATSGVTHGVTVPTPLVYNGAWSGAPDLSTAVEIQSDLVLSSDLQVCSCLVTNNATMTVNSGIDLTIKGKLTVEPGANMVVENNASLRQIDDIINEGNIDVEKNSSELFRQDYTMWSSPVAGQDLYDFSPMTLTNRYYVYGFNGTTGAYMPVNLANNNNSLDFQPGTGYLIRMPNQFGAGNLNNEGYIAGTYSYSYEGNFTGIPNNGTVAVALSILGDRYNSVGNPYASPINVHDFFTENMNNLNAGSALYFWRKKNDSNVNSYATLTWDAYVYNHGVPSGGGEPAEDYSYGGQQWDELFNGTEEMPVDPATWVINPGQGFIVKAAPITEPVVTFTNAMRESAVHNNQFFRNASDQTDAVSRFWLNLTDSQGGFSQTAIVYSSTATLGLDYSRDGMAFSGGPVSLYSIAENNNLSIQARPAFEDGDIVPMGYTAEVAGTFNITLHRKDGVFANGQKVYVKDNTNGTTHDLTASDYSFATEAGSFENRFEIVYTTSALDVNIPSTLENGLVLHKNGKQLKLRAGSAIESMIVYDMLGRIVYQAGNINAEEFSTPDLAVSHQVVLVKTQLANKVTVAKKIIMD